MAMPNKIEISPNNFENPEDFWERISNFSKGLLENGYQVSLMRDCAGVVILQFGSRDIDDCYLTWSQEEF